MSRLVGIFGGTFDPVHYGHLRPALDVMQQCGLDEVRFIPNRTPPHRDSPYLSDRQRAELVQLAIAHTPGFVMDDRELLRDGPSYMVDTLISLREEDPQSTFCLILGMDAYNGLPQWHRWQRIPELCHIIVTTRPLVEWVGLSQEMQATVTISHDPQCLQHRSTGQILLQSVTQLDISASSIRQYLQAGQSTQYLLPEALREKLEQAYGKRNK
ncbi:Nicotinate-nucleotide adenylyltransferase [hydrothermal vent metagenome]|uniref:Nicotinate-nucleotide adenylyltransferase n=1 Tax=hydrothermal vent metagenome TaxID=652676 RepID=A0A3B0YM37_9ZZZZ